MIDNATAMGVPLDNIAHVIQVALTPVFLLSGIGSLLNVVTTRLSRVSDQSDAVHALLRAASGKVLLSSRRALPPLLEDE